MTPQNHGPDDWTRHANALRRLARGLVRDADDREGLVQSTLAAAVERSERSVSWSWLAAVLRNRARDLARLRARRGEAPERELASAWPAPGEVAQRLELQEHLVRELRALDEPYQSTLYLRYFEELAPSAIAARTATPVKTVKTRLERGLALLRERMERKHGSATRERLLALLALPSSTPIAPTVPTAPVAPIARHAPGSNAAARPEPLGAPHGALGHGTHAASSLAKGGLVVMGKKLAALACVLVLLACWWLATRSDTGSSSAAHGTLASADALHPTDAPPALDAPAAASERESGASTPIANAPAAAPTRGTLRILAAWSGAAPAEELAAADVSIDVRSSERAPRFPDRPLVRLVTDGRGRTLATDLAPGPVEVTSDRGGSVRAEVVAGETRDVVVRIPAGLAATGCVLDAAEQPVANATIWMTTGHMDCFAMSPVALTDARGRFALRDVPARQSIGATAAGFAPSALFDFEQAPRRDGPVEVVLRLAERGVALEGRVLRADGTPAARADVCVGRSSYERPRSDGTFVETWGGRLSRCDDAGRFRVDGLEPGWQSIAVRAERAPLWSDVVEVNAGETRALNVALSAPVTVVGRVTNAVKELVTGTFVRAFARALRPDYLAMGQYDDPNPFGSPITLAGADGTYRLEEVWPGEAFLYASPPRSSAFADAFRPEMHAEFVLHARPDETATWDAVIEAGRAITGHVRYADGVPMADTFVSAVDEATSDRRTLRTGPEGAFEFFGLDPATYRIEVQLDGAPRGARPLITRGVAPSGAPLDLVADYPSPEKDPSAKVRGGFRDPSGKLPRLPEPVLASDDGVQRFPDRSDEKGFAFGALPAGKYRLLAMLGETLVHAGEPFELARSEERDLGAIEVGAGGTLTLRVKRAPGFERADAKLYLEFAGLAGGTLHDVPLEGDLVLKSVAAGRHVATLYAPGAVASARREFDVAGDTRVELALVPGVARRLQFTQPDSSAAEWIDVAITSADGATFYAGEFRGNPAEPFPFVVELAFPPGRFTVRASTKTGMRVEHAFEVGAELGTAEPITLPLAP
ncbi:MAG: carboxypeptidase regulatory-like domain-containing protein [Planctomycetes bacterium]|nr:carboxypeptidase regulatory-like domain-containing protein [Planctomycetota bacterium]